jgi:hypothetical protein
VHRPEYLKLIDTQTEGPRCDVTPLFADPRAFAALLDDFVALLYEVDFDVIAGIDALGFILGAALALWTHKGFVPVRKGGKLPVPVDMFEFVDYSGESKALELRRDAIAPGWTVGATILTAAPSSVVLTARWAPRIGADPAALEETQTAIDTHPHR